MTLEERVETLEKEAAKKKAASIVEFKAKKFELLLCVKS